MQINQLALTNFRSYPELELNFERGTTLFIGDNGSGKTNIAEAIIYLSYLSSHRVAQNQPLISLGKEQAIIRAEISRDDRKLQVDLEINASKANRAKLNLSPVRSQREILGACQVIYFTPEDLDLVRSDPAIRRDFLDRLLVLRSPRLAGVISDYERVVKQRNALLKTRSGAAALVPWNEQLVTLGATLVSERVALVTLLNPEFTRNYAQLNEVKPAAISYKSSTEGLSEAKDKNREILQERLEEVQYQEIERGISLVGPHRDDLYLQLSNFPVKGYASHGESWSIALSLRLGAFDLLRKEGAEPILILDDVFAELDNSRRAQLLQAATIAQQTIITSAVAEDLPTSLQARRYFVTPGKVVSK